MRLCFCLIIIGFCSGTLPIQASTQIKLFVSATMGQPLLNDLLKHSEGEVLVVRGIHSRQQNLAVDFQLWQQMLNTNNSTASVEIDPVAFQQDQIDRVPAMSLRFNGKTELTAFGVTSVDWLMRQYHAGRRGNIGSYGTTYPVSEPDLLEVLLQRLKQQNWHILNTKAQQRLQSKIFSSGVTLPTSRLASSKTLKLSGDWHIPMIVLDINDCQQQQAVASWLQEYPDAVVMVTNSSLPQLKRLPAIWHEHPIYIAPPEIVRRFQLSSLPALLTPENQNHWRVTTVAVSSFSVLDMMSWARTMISNTSQPVFALETTDNPSKALCQNVPILSEKLITSVPWKELFPISIGLAKLGSGKEPNDRARTSTGLCLCEDSAGMFHPGVTTGFWRPQRLIELTRSPGCLMALGGHKLPIVDQRRWGTLGSANIPKGLTYLHAHVYSLPLIEMLNMFTGIGGCNSDLVDFDLINLSEVDPSWSHPELAALLSPDLAAYANPAAMNACTAEGLATLNSQPMDSLHWCAGSWGNLYPLSGFHQHLRTLCRQHQSAGNKGFSQDSPHWAWQENHWGGSSVP